MVSVIIPAKNEKYLERTIRSVLDAATGEIEVIAVLDGYLPDPPIHMKDDRAIFVHFKDAIGQRQAINEGVKISKGEFIMKLDAHCNVAKGFDVILANDCKYEWTMIPRMYNLNSETWEPKLHKRTDYMYISGMEAEKPFRASYYGSRQPRNDIEIDETMCCMGPCFFMHKKRFLELGGCDTGHGGWGQQGVEVSCKAWLSGGALMVNKRTWFAHWFRGGGGPGFPYKISGNDQVRARQYSQNLWLNDKWDKATRPMSWLVDKFNPPGWVNDMTILFYTSNIISKKIMEPVLRSLKKHCLPIISVSQESMDLGKNIVVPKKVSLQNIYRQVLIGAKAAKTKYVALCEDDCIYVSEHFKFRPKKSFGYNLNRWLLHLDEKVFSYRRRPILSQCIAKREDLIKNLEERFALSKIPDKYCGEMGVFDKKLGMTEYEYETFDTKNPNMVVCHKDNTLKGRKLLGKDAEPKTELESYGRVDYWVKKFTDKSDGKPRVRPQTSYITGKSYKIKDILDNLEWFWDYRKMVRFPLYKHCLQFFQDIHDGKVFNSDEELKAHPYFQYLLAGWSEPNNPKILSRCLFHMRDGIKLYHDIKANGMIAPIEMWAQKNKYNIHRGLRRIAIQKVLRYERIPIRIYKSRFALEKLQGEAQGHPDDSIHGVAVKQFARLGSVATDKFWIHNYTPTYNLHLADKRNTYKKVLEIGVLRGGSLLLWHDVFPNAQIYGVDKDISKARLVKHLDRVTLLQGMQGDDAFFKAKVIPCGKFDLIVDDCSHKASHQKETLELLWDSVESGGYYVIEDLHWRSSTDKTAVNKLKDMIDSIDKLEIESMNFYYNIVFIRKR